MALFTQKHYEFLQGELRKEFLGESLVVVETHVDVLCRVFERDNPRFKRGEFRSNVLKQTA